MKGVRIAKFVVLVAALGLVGVEVVPQLQDRLMAWGDPMAPWRVRPVDSRSVLVIGGRTAVAVGTMEPWPTRLAAELPDLKVAVHTRPRLGLRRLLRELPVLLAEHRPRRVLLQLGSDEMFDAKVSLSEVEARRLQGHRWRWGYPRVFAEPVSVPALVGTWRAGPLVVAFFEDGVVRLRGSIGRWSQRGRELTIVSADGSRLEFELAIVEERLRLRSAEGLAEVFLTRGAASETLAERVQRVLRSGDLAFARVLVDSQAAQSIEVDPVAVAEIAALEGRSDPLFPAEAGPEPDDDELVRIERDLRLVLQVCRLYGAEPSLVELPFESLGSVDRLIADVAASMGVAVVETRAPFRWGFPDRPLLFGVDCTAAGHAVVADAAVRALRGSR